MSAENETSIINTELGVERRDLNVKKDFRIHFADEQFEELRRRISMTRLPKPIEGDNW